MQGHGREDRTTSEPNGAPGGDAGRKILERVSRQVGPDAYRRYFEHQTLVRCAGSRVEITVPTGFVADLIAKRYGDSLKSAAREELGQPGVEVAFRIDRGPFVDSQRIPGRDERGARPAPSLPPGTLARRLTPPTPVSPATERYRLEDFEVGESNQLAHAAAMTLLSAECPKSARMLFIHGPCGVGKTHLVNAVAGAARHRGETVVNLTAETFTNEYISAVQADKLPSFRERYRGVSMLCIDDVQFLRNKKATQIELLHTFDAIDLSGAKVMLASDEHPRQVEKLSQALVSRFMAGMVVRIDPPEPALRARIVSRLAAKRGLKIDQAGASLIAARCGGAAPTARDVEGVLTRIEALRGLPNRGGGDGAVGLVLIRKALGLGEQEPPVDAKPVRPVRMTLIIEEVCRALRVEPSELFGKGRHKRVVLARSMCALLGRWLTTMSYPEMARAMGRPNHSTIVTAVQRLQSQIAAGEMTGPYLGTDLDGAGGGGLAAELAGLSLHALSQQLRDDVLRATPGV